MKSQLLVSAVCASIAAFLGAVLTEKAGDPSALITSVEQRLTHAFQPVDIPVQPGGNITKVTQVAPPWSELEAIWEPLTWQNQRVAKAKALLHYDSNPSSFESYAWDGRFVAASEPWHVEEAGQFLLRRLQGAAIGGAGGFGAVFAFLLLLSWLWKFLLARLREVSDAIRGR